LRPPKSRSRFVQRVRATGRPLGDQGAGSQTEANEIRRIEEPEEVRWAGNRSLLLTLRLAIQVLRSEPELAEDLLALAHSDARQIIEDAHNAIVAIRSNSPVLWRMVDDLAESIKGEIEADDDAADVDAPEDEDDS
jgi:hypothetical protein